MGIAARLLATVVLTLVAHVLVGWWLTPVAALAGGAWQGRGGWWLGLLALVFEWGAWLVFSYFANPAPFDRMTETVGGILGNLPSGAVVAATLVIAALLGALGGLAGTQVRTLVRG